SELPLTTLMIFLPLAGGLLLLFVGDADEAGRGRVCAISMAFSLAALVVSAAVYAGFRESFAGMQFVERAEWIPRFGISYYVGLDGISLPLILLTTFLTPIVLLYSWNEVEKRVRLYHMALLFLETAMLGVFVSLDFFLFYVLWEGMLIPMYLIIGVWGGPRRIYAAVKFFLYTMVGSVLMLVAILWLYFETGAETFDILVHLDKPVHYALQGWLFAAFALSFAIKVPIFPFHTWLPDAHVEAPTAGSVILAGVLLKFGGYGFLRFSLPLFPIATVEFTPLIFTLSVIAVIYTSLVALVQEDMKKLIAYSSVAHMGFVTVGTFSLTVQGIEGAIIQMLSHGVVSAALFLVVGVVYDRMHSRTVDTYGGLVHRMPSYAFMFMLFMMASVGLPGTSGFVGEFLILVGIFQVNTLVAALTTTGIILGAAYMLYLYRRIIFGKLTKESLQKIFDLSGREIAVFAPLALVVIWMGIYPMPFLDAMHASVNHLIGQVETARTLNDAVVLVGHSAR
ncbi:MAG: NADH-quinone oxidoreductase subunit M, partial [Rhodospirillales bacterium]|nr:NADH-quinone oxidoreductase subunit M [Rhodospirillales bacterium]